MIILNRKVLAKLFNITRENMYHPKRNWTFSVKGHLNESMDENGLIRQSLLSKPFLFLSHPLPECSCRISSVKVSKPVKGKDGRYLYGGEDECPKWMQQGQKPSSVETAEGGANDDSDSPEYDNDMSSELESSNDEGKSSSTLVFDRDDEWDPND